MNWRFTDESQQVVVRVHDNGSMESCLVSAIQDWIEAGNTPDPYVPPAIPDWRPDAASAFYVQRKARMDVLTAMQMDYTALGQVSNAASCLTIKQALKELENTDAVLSVYNDPNATKAQYTAAVKAAWNAAIAPLPVQVKIDFIKYGGNTT